MAGDFYWLEETERYVFLGVADVTGHGVPGAFVSLVCVNALNKAVREEGLESPARILSRTKALVSELLTREGGKLPDGMDVVLVRFEKGHPWQLVYAGANRPLWIVSHEKELIELSPTRQPVGYTYDEKPFEEVAVDLVARRPVMVYGGSANLRVFLGHKKLCRGALGGGHLSQISTPRGRDAPPLPTGASGLFRPFKTSRLIGHIPIRKSCVFL